MPTVPLLLMTRYSYFQVFAVCLSTLCCGGCPRAKCACQCFLPNMAMNFFPVPCCPQGYIYRLDNFDGPAVAEKAIEHGLAEEAFEIYKKFNKRVEAIKVRAQQGTGVDSCTRTPLPSPHHSQPAVLPLFRLLPGRLACFARPFLASSTHHTPPAYP